MIPYDKHQWTSHLFDVEGSMVREIIGRVAICVLWSALVVLVHQAFEEITVSPVVHTLVGAALGLLLVFRTNASYDRYWEGRRLWGAITNESRNLSRLSRAYLAPIAPDLAESILLWTSAFAYAAMNGLRNTTGLGPPGDRLPASEVAEVLNAPHASLAVAKKMTEQLAKARDRGVLSDYLVVAFDNMVSRLMDDIGGCERIYRTPLPFVYVVHLRRALILYCYTLPLCLVQFYGWWTIVATLLTSYTFFGIEEIGVEIENPFGGDPNDLPLELFCETIERDTTGMPVVSKPIATSA